MYIIQFDKTYLDGTLVGLTIPGEICRFDSRADAERALRFYHRVEIDRDFIRAVGTGNRYTVSNIAMLIEPSAAA